MNTSSLKLCFVTAAILAPFHVKAQQDRSVMHPETSRTPPTLNDLDYNPEEDDYFSSREAERTHTALGGYYTNDALGFTNDDDALGFQATPVPYGGNGLYGYDGRTPYSRFYTDQWWER